MFTLSQQISKTFKYSKKAKHEAKKAHKTSNSALTTSNSAQITSNSALTTANTAMNAANLACSSIINNYAVCYPSLNSYSPGDSIMQWAIEPSICSNGITIATNNADITFTNCGVYYMNFCLNCNSNVEGRIQVTLLIGSNGSGTATQYTEQNQIWTGYATFNAIFSVKVSAGQSIYFVLTNEVGDNWTAEADTYWSRLQINQVN